MAYLAPAQIGDEKPLPGRVLVRSWSNPATFTQLEWSVIRLSQNDKTWSTISTPFQHVLNFLLARRANRLANDRLEALRRMAVFARQFGFTVPADKLAAFLGAGFSVEQFELIVSSLRPAKSQLR